MPLKIMIMDDEQLRSDIKELIKEQVKSLARMEIFSVLNEEIDKKIKSIDYTYVKTVANVNLATRVDQLLKESGVTPMLIRGMVNDKVNEIVSTPNKKKEIRR